MQKTNDQKSAPCNRLNLLKTLVSRDKTPHVTILRELSALFEFKTRSAVVALQEAVITVLKSPLDNSDIQPLLKSNGLRNLFLDLTSIKNAQNKFTAINVELRRRQLPILIIPTDDQQRLIEQYRKKVLAKNTSVIEIDRKTLDSLVDHLVASSNLYENICLAALVSGCRMIEILDKRVTTFSEASANDILQIGVAKDRKSTMVVKKPILYITPEEFMTLINSIRENVILQNKSRTQVTNKYCSRVNSAFRLACTRFGINPPRSEFKLHLARKIYANLAWSIYGKRSHMSYPIYIMQKLGHKTPSTVTSYSNVKIKGHAVPYDPLQPEQKTSCRS